MGHLFQHKWPNSKILIPALELSYSAGQLVVPLKLFGKQTTLGNKNHTQLGTKEALGEEGTPSYVAELAITTICYSCQEGPGFLRLSFVLVTLPASMWMWLF